MNTEVWNNTLFHENDLILLFTKVFCMNEWVNEPMPQTKQRTIQAFLNYVVPWLKVPLGTPASKDEELSVPEQVALFSLPTSCAPGTLLWALTNPMWACHKPSRHLTWLLPNSAWNHIPNSSSPLLFMENQTHSARSFFYHIPPKAFPPCLVILSLPMLFAQMSILVF